MALYSLVPKTCRALQAYIMAHIDEIDGLPLANVHAHKDAEPRELPNVTIRCDTATPKSGNPGAWTVNVKIWVATSMIVNPEDTDTDPISESDNLAAQVIDLFYQNIVGQNNAALADAITEAARAAVYTGVDPDQVAAARPWANLADFKCDYIRHLGGIDIQTDPNLNAYMDVFGLQLEVRASTATEP